MRILITLVALLTACATVPKGPPMVMLKGKHINLYVPADKVDLGQQMYAQIEKALPLYAKFFGRKIPKMHDVHLFASRELYEQGQKELSTAVTKNPGYSDTVGINILMGSADLMRELALHESAHAYQKILYDDYDGQPAWLREGLADLLVERALTREISGEPPANSVRDQHVTGLRGAIGKKEFISLGDFFKDDEAKYHIDEKDQGKASSLHYAEAYCIVRLLDSPANPERQKKFRDLLKNSFDMDPFMLTDRMNKKVRNIIGDLPAFETELKQWVNSVDVAAKPL